VARIAKKRRAALDKVMREAISEATINVLQQHGLDGTTMDRIAQETGVAKGTLYNYYQDKDDLIQDVYTKMVEPIFETLAGIRDSSMAPAEKLEKSIRESIVYFEQNRVAFRVFEETGVKERSKQYKHQRGLELLEPILEEGIQDGAFRAMNARQAAVFILETLSGFFESSVERGETLDLEADLKELMDFYLHGLSPIQEKKA
jgi:AcrR family transcriptional regulator